MTYKTAQIAVLAALLAHFEALPAARAADDALPKAETILDRYIEVTGGKAAYEKRRSASATGVVEFPAQGIKGTVERYGVAPDRSYLAMTLEGIGKIESGTIGGVAWEKSAILGARIKSGAEKEQSLREGAFNGELRWRELYAKVETTGVETVNGEECYKVVLTPKVGNAETNYYQKKSGLAVKTTTVAASQLGEVPIEVTMSDYKNFGGVLVATKSVQKAVGQEIVLTIQDMKVNEAIAADRFELPGDVKALLNKGTAQPPPAGVNRALAAPK